MTLPGGPSLVDIGAAASGAWDATQRMLRWMQQTQAAQLSATEACSKAMQSALEAAARARDPGELLQAQNRLFTEGLEEASRCQREAVNAWLALQSEVAMQWPKQAAEAQGFVASSTPQGVLETPDWAAVLEQARSSFDDAMRQWNSFWNRSPGPTASHS